ncbi:MAG: carbohydrate-binding protein [Oscillatoria sp. PMC 1051.18]|nr:carbohydrate-binding protein [Oscillatoria sp. PMC 1050.18]MEC5032051.1 carbohydrate-binding protein [Oscillatoria sp. PMC 1051.18]
MEYLIPAEVGFDLGDSTTFFQIQSVLGDTIESFLPESSLGDITENIGIGYDLRESKVLIDEQESNLNEETDLLTGLTDSSPLLNSELGKTAIRVEAENYTNYFDLTVENEGGEYRNGGVDIQTTSDTSGEYEVSSIQTGEWLEYEVFLPQEGGYWVSLRAAGQGDDNYVVSVNEQEIWLTGSGDKEDWQTISSVVPLKLESGKNTIRLEFPSGVEGEDLFNLNYLELSPAPFLSSTSEPPVFPLRIEAENYTSYSDSTDFNEGAPYRPDEGVDIRYTTDVGGGYNVGWIQQGESLDYEVVIPEAGKYWVNVRVAATGDDNHALSVNGQEIWFTGTGDSYEWQTVTGVVPIKLEEGTKTIRLEAPLDTDERYLFEINYFELVKNPFSDSPVEIKVEAEDFTDYVDLTPWNEGALYRPAEGVDTQKTSDVDGGYNVGWIKQGEWLEYAVNLPRGGEFWVDVRVAAPGDDNHALSVNGQEIWITPTGGWQEWETVSTVVPLKLDAGINTIRLEAVTGTVGENLFNINYFDLTPVDSEKFSEVEDVEILPLSRSL